MEILTRTLQKYKKLTANVMARKFKTFSISSKIGILGFSKSHIMNSELLFLSNDKFDIVDQNLLNFEPRKTVIATKYIRRYF